MFFCFPYSTSWVCQLVARRVWSLCSRTGYLIAVVTIFSTTSLLLPSTYTHLPLVGHDVHASREDPVRSHFLTDCWFFDRISFRSINVPPGFAALGVTWWSPLQGLGLSSWVYPANFIRWSLLSWVSSILVVLYVVVLVITVIDMLFTWFCSISQTTAFTLHPFFGLSLIFLWHYQTLKYIRAAYSTLFVMCSESKGWVFSAFGWQNLWNVLHFHLLLCIRLTIIRSTLSHSFCLCIHRLKSSLCSYPYCFPGRY